MKIKLLTIALVIVMIVLGLYVSSKAGLFPENPAKKDLVLTGKLLYDRIGTGEWTCAPGGTWEWFPSSFFNFPHLIPPWGDYIEVTGYLNTGTTNPNEIHIYSYSATQKDTLTGAELVYTVRFVDVPQYDVEYTGHLEFIHHHAIGVIPTGEDTFFTQNFDGIVRTYYER